MGRLKIYRMERGAQPRGKVVGAVLQVYDGDTVKMRGVMGPVCIRLAGIDAPEHGQAFFFEAREHLRGLCFPSPVTADVLHADRYARSVAVLSTERNRDFGLSLVCAGLAWFYPAFGRAFGHYREAQEIARAAGVGIWSQAEPVTPWAFRKSGRVDILPGK